MHAAIPVVCSDARACLRRAANLASLTLLYPPHMLTTGISAPSQAHTCIVVVMNIRGPRASQKICGIDHAIPSNAVSAMRLLS